jgi:hypothetical protein
VAPAIDPRTANKSHIMLRSGPARLVWPELLLGLATFASGAKVRRENRRMLSSASIPLPPPVTAAGLLLCHSAAARERRSLFLLGARRLAADRRRIDDRARVAIVSRARNHARPGHADVEHLGWLILSGRLRFVW